MANTLQFVDKIDASPTLRLDLNQAPPSGKWYLKAADFSPPRLKKVRISTLLTDGNYIPASAYENRFVELTLILIGTSKDDQATELQKFNREMDRQNNILKWQPAGATAPVFFRTFRSDYTWRLLPKADENVNTYEIRARIEAEPFARGLRVTQSPVTVNNDPAAGSNGLFLSVTGVTGDVATPAFIQIDPSAATITLQSLIAVRRHGTPAFYWVQAEACTQVTDTTTQPNDAQFSGAGNNYSRTTFATATMQTRLQWPNFPTASGVDNRGVYRLFARLKKSVAGDAINLRFVYGTVISDAVAMPSTTNRHWLDLGLIPVPASFPDPIVEGYSNTQQSVGGTTLNLQAEREPGGSGNLDWDAIVAVPADEEMAIVSYGAVSGQESILDGPLDKEYARLIATGVLTVKTDPTTRIGTLPLLQPNQTNLLVFLADVGLGTNNEDKTWTTSVTVSFWPAYLYCRPAST